MEKLIDSKKVIYLVVKDTKKTEHRLNIDVHALRERYGHGELTRIGWIPGNCNPADSLTKIAPLKKERRSTLSSLMTTKILLAP